MHEKVEMLKLVLDKDKKITSPKLIEIITTINEIILSKEKSLVRLDGEIENLRAQMTGLKNDIQKIKVSCNVK